MFPRHMFSNNALLHSCIVRLYVCDCVRVSVREGVCACKCVCMRNCKEYNHPFVGEAKIADDINQDKKHGFFIDACEPATPLSPFMGVVENDRNKSSTNSGFFFNTQSILLNVKIA